MENGSEFLKTKEFMRFREVSLDLNQEFDRLY